MPERRLHPRIPCELQVRVEGLPAPVSLTTRDVSRGGVFLFSRVLRPLNSEVDVTLQAGRQALRARGRVVHHLPDVGFGVQFMSLADDDRTRLDQFLADAEANGPPGGPGTPAG